MSRKKKTNKGTWCFYGIPLTVETLFSALYIISIIVAAYIVLDNINKSANLPWWCLLYICFCALVYHHQKLDDKQDLHEKVAWIAEKECCGKLSGRDLELVEIVEIEQNNQNIPEQFRINFLNEAEKENLTKILNSHKEHVVKAYFSGCLTEPINAFRLDTLEYYFFSLNCFVYDKLSEYKVDEAYSNKEYVSSYQFKCQLTDYGRVYYKLGLITQLYIENNKYVQKLYKYIDKELTKRIMEYLEKNEVSFLSYRP